VPARLGVDSEGNRERIGRPLPALCQSRLKFPVIEGVEIGSDNEEIIVDLLIDLPSGPGCSKRREKRFRVCADCDDNRSPTGGWSRPVGVTAGSEKRDD
jgi:hypothetical protein